MVKILELLFPPRPEFHKVEFYQEACVAYNDPTAIPLTEDGVLWRGYDVKLTGVEKIEMGLWQKS